MKKLFYRILLFALCFSILTSLGACKKTNTSSDGNNSNIGLMDFDDESDAALTKDNSLNSSDNSKDGTDGKDKNNSSIETKPKDFSEVKDVTKEVPKRLRGSTIQFACWGDEGHAQYKAVYDKFTAKTGIKVNLMFVDEAHIITDVAQRVAAGSSPDIMVNNYRPVSVYDILQPVNKFIDLNDDFWDANITKIMTVGGNTYGVNSLYGMWENANYIIYNKDLFAKNSITSPGDYWKRGKWTYENMLKCMQDITKTGNYGGMVDPQIMTASFGVPIISYDPSTETYKNNISDPTVASAYDFGHNLYKEKIWDLSQWFGLFANGKIGLMDGGNYGARFNGKFNNADPNMLASVPFPTSYKGKETYQVFSLRSYGIVKGAKNPEAATYFLRYLLDYSYYKDAGLRSFMNKEMESFYFDDFLPKIKKGELKVIYDFTEQAQKLLYPDGDLPGVVGRTEIESGQYSTILASKKNELDNAAATLTKDLQKYK